MGSVERRKHFRVSVELSAAITFGGDGEPTPAVIANVSSRGIFVRGDQLAKENTPVRVEFILTPEHVVCTATGRVAFRGPLGVGINLDEVNEHYRDYIESLSRAVQANRSMSSLFERILGEVNIEFDAR